MKLPDVKTEIKKIKLSDIVFKEEIYARFEPDQRLISKYEENADTILRSSSKIKVSHDNILIDGYHRWKAFERVYGKDSEIDVCVYLTDNTDFIELESYAANQTHGKANTKEETFRNVQRLYSKGHDTQTIIDRLSIQKSWVLKATETIRATEKEERNRKAVELYLRAWNTQETVAKELDIARSTLEEIINTVENSISGKIGKEWNLDHTDPNYNPLKPIRYNIWNTLSKKNGETHFGSFPQIFMENLLYYYTEPLDIVFDPFAGSGTTIDACKSMFRRYYCTDLMVKPGREGDIIQHDITRGLPDKLPKHKLVFLDPPYWKQAKGQYTDKATDLSNMELPAFYQSFETLFKELKPKLVDGGYIAFIISSTQWPNDNKNVEPHFHKLWNIAENSGFVFENLIHIPYSTEQYNGNQVKIAKEQKLILQLNRELVVMRKDEKS